MTTEHEGNERHVAPEEDVGRRLPLWGWAVLVVAYLALLEIVTRLVATERPAIDELRSNRTCCSAT